MKKTLVINDNISNVGVYLGHMLKFQEIGVIRNLKGTIFKSPKVKVQFVLDK